MIYLPKSLMASLRIALGKGSTDFEFHTYSDSTMKTVMSTFKLYKSGNLVRLSLGQFAVDLVRPSEGEIVFYSGFLYGEECKK